MAGLDWLDRLVIWVFSKNRGFFLPPQNHQFQKRGCFPSIKLPSILRYISLFFWSSSHKIPVHHPKPMMLWSSRLLKMTWGTSKLQLGSWGWNPRVFHPAKLWGSLLGLDQKRWSHWPCWSHCDFHPPSSLVGLWVSRMLELETLEVLMDYRFRRRRHIKHVGRCFRFISETLPVILKSCSSSALNPPRLKP